MKTNKLRTWFGLFKKPNKTTSDKPQQESHSEERIYTSEEIKKQPRDLSGVLFRTE